jgi:hypothetical protein
MSDVPATATTLIAEGAWPRDRLDADYTAKNCVTPERFAQIIAEYGNRSRPAKAMAGARLDLVYDGQSGEKLDLYGTRAGELRPLLIFIHGGYWRALSKDQSAFMAPLPPFRSPKSPARCARPLPGSGIRRKASASTATALWSPAAPPAGIWPEP